MDSTESYRDYLRKSFPPRESDEEREDRLYRESRSLKFQAREMRKKRIEKEAAEIEKARDKAARDKLAYQTNLEAQKKARKKDFDDRLRRVMFNLIETLKREGLAIDVGKDEYGYKANVMKIIDQKATPEGSGSLVFNEILRTQVVAVLGKGFEWE